MRHRRYSHHPYVDGSKRAGWTLAEAFLNRNGMKVTADNDEIFKVLVALAGREMNEEEFSNWLEFHSHPLQ